MFFALYVVSIPSKNVYIHAASKRKDQCTFEGIKGLFKRSANSVGTQGIFIFHFTGHAVRDRRSGKWGLVPTDYVGGSNPSAVITSSDMVDWLHQSTFQGRYCLFILDVCCAEGFADDVITQSVQQEVPVAGLYIISSRTANESSLIVPALGMTYFSFFFSTLNNHCDPGRIRVSDLYQSCNVCCMAFSSLILSYDQVTQTLRMNTTLPDYKQYQLPSYLRSLYGEQEDEESTDSGRFHFLFKQYDSSQNPIDIPDKCLAWLDTISDLNSGLLCELKEKGLLQGKMIIAAIATMTYSVALNMSCLLDNKLTPSRISSRNAFVITLLYVISTVEKHQSVSITPSDVCMIIDYYIEALNVKKISTKDVRKLKSLIQQTQQQSAIEETDSGPSTSEVCTYYFNL